jgi:hypothetical protein
MHGWLVIGAPSQSPHPPAAANILLLLPCCHPTGAKAALKVPPFLSERAKSFPDEPNISCLVQLALMRLHWKAVPLLIQAGAPWPDSSFAAPQWDQEHGWEGLEVRPGFAAVMWGVLLARAAAKGVAGREHCCLLGLGKQLRSMQTCSCDSSHAATDKPVHGSAVHNSNWAPVTAHRIRLDWIDALLPA